MPNDNDEIIRKLTMRVYHLEQEIIKLGGQPYKMENINETHEDFSADILPEVNTSVDIESVIKRSDKQDDSSIKKQVEEPVMKKQNVENRIGKNGMAILASILIFFSLILFAGIAFSYLSNVAKVVIMFVVSIAIAAFGIIKMQKRNEENNIRFKTFYTTLAACGIGAIYITDLVAYFGFKCMPLVMFIISLVIWIAVTMVLAYKCSSIFIYISNIGLIIATVLTAVQFESSLMAFALYTICLIALYTMNRNNDFNHDSYYFIQYPIVFIILSCAVETGYFSYAIFIILLIGIFAFENTIYKIEKKHIATNIIGLLLNIAALIRICAGMGDNAIKYVTIFILIGIMSLYFVKHYRSLRILFYAVYFITYSVSVLIFATTDIYNLVALVPFITLIIVGFAKKDVWIRLGGYLALIISYMIHMNSHESMLVFVFYFVLGILSVAGIAFISYSLIDKYMITAILCYILFDASNTFNFNVCITFIIFAALAFITNTKVYYKNPNTGTQEISSKIIGYVINFIMILTGIITSYSRSMTPELYQVVVIMLATIALCSINTTKLLRLRVPELLAGFYICIKYSLCIYTILHRLQAASYVISIVGILIAITCIMIGFRFKQKAFRLYGLIISMISVIKLILFDISYDSNILRPVGFFVSGILCFAISFIYSKLEKGIYEQKDM